MTSVLQVRAEAHTAKRELATDLLRASGAVRLRAAGWSMLPAVWPGDTLVVEPTAASDVSAGEIVVFSCASRFVAHRVIANRQASENSKIQTRGDAMLQPDPPVSGGELVGKVVLILRGERCIEPARRLGVCERAFATLLQHSPITARIIVRAYGRLKTTQRPNFNQRAIPCQS
jgi:hypothetical protein